LHVGLHEVLRVRLEYLVDLVEKVVEFALSFSPVSVTAGAASAVVSTSRLVVFFDFWVRSASVLPFAVLELSGGDVGSIAVVVH